MSNNHDPKSELLLDRHIEALKAEKLPAGPSQQTIASTLTMLRTATPSPGTPGEGRGEGLVIDGGTVAPVTGRRPFIERLAAMTFPQRLAATVLLTIGALIIYLMFALFNSLAPSVAFADVVEKVKSIRTAAYTSTITLPGKAPTTMHTQVLGPGRMRTEISGGIVINDGSKALSLDPVSHTATRFEFDRDPTVPGQQNIIESFQQLAKAAGEPIGEKVIDGVKTVGFRAMRGATTVPSSAHPITTIWADKNTALPVRVETTLPAIGGETLIVMDHFEINPPLDESQFSLDLPPGYRVASTQKLELPKFSKPEEFVADFLRVYAEANDGTFPESLTDPYVIQKLPMQKMDQPTAMKMVMRTSAVTAVCMALGDRYGYAGKDVKLGEKDKVVFWYRFDPKSTKYRALFGDLHAGDVTADQLPATRPSKS